MDITKFKTVIKNVLRNLKVRPQDKEDMEQECFVALLEKQTDLEKAEDAEGYAAAICKTKVLGIYRSRDKELKTESLEQPGIYQKAEKFQKISGLDIPEESLQSAILVLPYRIYQVVYSLFVEGNSEEKTAKDLGITRHLVRVRSQWGINSLKKYFEVDDGS